ncbi:MAG TPA: amidohydrolase family protein [Puia sp.]|jgi:imidazolonepropionase-like amidohydrolase|nr:amidohydrolase family protein [Puia sp.]
MKPTCLIAAITLCMALTSTQAQTNLNRYALTGVTLIDANHIPGLAHQTVVIRNSKIEEIFLDGTRTLPDTVSILPAIGKYLIPGLIDTHVHMATDPSGTDNRANTLKVLERMLRSGITTVRDMAGDARVLAGLSRDARTGDILSPDIYYSALMAGPEFFTDPRTHSSTAAGVAGEMPFMRAVTPTTDFTLAVAEAKGTGATGIKLYADIDPVTVEKIVFEAKRQGLLVWGHAWLQQARPSDLIKAGVSSISHAPLLLYETMDSIPTTWKLGHHDGKFWDDHVHADPTMLANMKAHHTILDATFLTYERLGSQDSSRRYIVPIIRRLTAQAYKAGVTICTGTDDDQEVFVQGEMAALVKDAGFSNADALIAATRNGARALGIESTAGTIETGKTADLVVLNNNPLEDIDNINTVYLVIKAGKLFR